jgi:hypothetical protein
MGVAAGYKKEIINITKRLPDDKLKVLIDFAQYLRAKEEFTYIKVGDSTAYVRELRRKEIKRVKSGKRFIEELIEWQKSNS